MMTNEQKFETRLTMQVSPRIIQLISSGLYRSPASAIKELLSNSFDADAKSTKIYFNFDYKEGEIYLESILVEDDGEGMNLDNLQYAFTHIGGSLKSIDEKSKTSSGREVIGNLGIGILSIASACRAFKIITKKRDEHRVYTAEVSLDFFDKVQAATETMDKFSIGNVIITSSGVSESDFNHFTKIEIKDFKPPFLASVLNNLGKSYFFQKKCDNEKEEESKYQEYYEGFISCMQKLNKIGNLQQLDQIIASVGLMTPVAYLDDGPIKSKVKDINGEPYEIPGTDNPEYLKLKSILKNLKFNVYIEFKVQGKIKNNFKLYKPILYPSADDIKSRGGAVKLDPYVAIIGPKTYKLKDEADEKIDIKINGYVYHQNARIMPHDYRGMLYRVLNVAIGDKFSDDLRLYSENPIILHQMFMEIFLNKGFRRSVNLDRESLYEGSRAYIYLRAYLDNILNGKVPPKPSASMPKTDSDYMQSGQNKNQASENSKTIPETPLQNEPKRLPDISDFYKSLQEEFKEGDGIVKIVKDRQSILRKEKTNTTDPYEKTVEIFKEKKKSTPTIITTKDKSQYGKIEKKNENESIVRLPPIEGTRAKLWKSIFLIALMYAPDNNEEKINLIDSLYKIYRISEKGDQD